MEAPESKATADLENPREVKVAKRQLALQGFIKSCSFAWLEIPAQEHPRAPNPYDDYSKRGWEKAMSVYRRKIREMETITKHLEKKTSNLLHQENGAKIKAAA